MQFKYPEILFALFLLLIPIIIHFFQLRKFKKEAFTNVAFLKRIKLQTRKSSQLKKWLTLLARMLALAALIMAFAQPYIPHTAEALKEKETVIYLDNSFSMQQKGEQGPLLQQAVQQLLQSFPEEEEPIILTNDRVFGKEKINQIKNDLLTLDYSPAKVSLKTAYLKAQNLFSSDENNQKRFIALSDFQTINLKEIPNFDPSIEVHLIRLKGKNTINFSIDSIYLSGSEVNTSEIKVQLKASRANEETLPISLYNGDQLIAKSSAGFNQDTLATVEFSLSGEEENLIGRLVIEDQGLSFDNTTYFNLQKPEAIRVAVLYENEAETDFLRKLYKEPEFDLQAMAVAELDYNQLENKNLIVLNELDALPNGLEEILGKHKENGGSLILIPSPTISLSPYNRLLTHLGLGQLGAFTQGALNITRINFDHPLFTDVFDGRVTNFQYPRVEGRFNYRGNASSILTFSDGTDFILERNKTYLVTAPLRKSNSNFKRSPLIVPVFYNMAKHSLKLPELAYTIGKENVIEITEELNKDEVLTLKNEEDEFIPQQNRFNQKVALTFNDLPEKAGTYDLMKGQEVVGHLSFNYDRSENRLVFSDLTEFGGLGRETGISEFFTDQSKRDQIDQLWKWLVLLGIVFLGIEVLLLKFLK